MRFNPDSRQMRKALLVILFIVCIFPAIGQPPKRITVPEYISTYKSDAIKDMMKMGVPASITLAQGILESESGNSDLAHLAKNHFGIKCHNDWSGETYHKDDDAKDECFRKYNSVLDSYVDHGRFLRERSRYAFLFDYSVQDYKSWSHGLKKAGYATNPKYADMLIRLIEEHDLSQFDRGGKNIPVQPGENVTVAASPSSPPPKPGHKNANTSPKTGSSVSVTLHDVPYIIAGSGDSWLSVAMAHDLRLWQVLNYNDAGQNDVLSPGDPVYLKPKRGRPQQEFHTVQGDESLWQISQKYCVKMKRLVKLNDFSETISLQAGQNIKLR